MPATPGEARANLQEAAESLSLTSQTDANFNAQGEVPILILFWIAGLLTAVIDFPSHGRVPADNTLEPHLKRLMRERGIDGPDDKLFRRADGDRVSRARRILAEAD